jgi:hypothetical protein
MENTIASNSNYVIHPESSIKIIFDLIGLILILYQTLMVPFTVAFYIEDPVLNIIDNITDIFFILEIFFNFNSGFYVKGLLIMNRKEICRNYSKGWLSFDIISSFPFSFVLNANTENINVNILNYLLLDSCT